ncbi:MAG: hypothetical protein MRK02_06220 [Candidatus Scalindua sp.]|nr:hypothetical protein [Candidatus Scalindua sp.]
MSVSTDITISSKDIEETNIKQTERLMLVIPVILYHGKEEVESKEIQ